MILKPFDSVFKQKHSPWKSWICDFDSDPSALICALLCFHQLQRAQSHQRSRSADLNVAGTRCREGESICVRKLYSACMLVCEYVGSWRPYPCLINIIRMSVCRTDLLLLFNGKSFRPAVFCKRFLNLFIRFLNKNIHRENRESVILIVILCRSSLSSLPFP